MKHFNVGLHVKGKERYLLGNRAREYMHGDKIAIAVLCNSGTCMPRYAMLRYAMLYHLVYFTFVLLSYPQTTS